MRVLPHEVRAQDKFAEMACSMHLLVPADRITWEILNWLSHRSQERELAPAGDLTITHKVKVGDKGAGLVSIKYVVQVNGFQPTAVEEALIDLHGYLQDRWRQIGDPQVSFFYGSRAGDEVMARTPFCAKSVSV